MSYLFPVNYKSPENYIQRVYLWELFHNKNNNFDGIRNLSDKINQMKMLEIQFRWGI